MSTTKQGSEGVSLHEQRAAIERYAETHDLQIVRWFEEQETAAKQGRPLFAELLRSLKRGSAEGVILHKIDRGARNLRDWADLGELVDLGVDVHCATEGLDLRSRGGRLSADIQAVVASDFIRNLREETRKGFYGRLKQGLYPLPAPIGYLDQGKGKSKVPDPLKVPFIRRAFELYASGAHTLHSLRATLAKEGFTNRNGGALTINGLSTILNNPFYVGLIRISSTGEVFEGVHEPLIGLALFERVQDVLAGRTQTRIQKHDLLFRRLFRCAACGRALIGERQKGYVYYRCHTKDCPVTSVREEAIEAQVKAVLAPVFLTASEMAELEMHLRDLRGDWHKCHEAALSAHAMQVRGYEERLDRLTDAFVDGLLDKAIFEERRATLLVKKKACAEKHEEILGRPDAIPNRIAAFLEQAKDVSSRYELGTPPEKRWLLESTTSNRRVAGKRVAVELSQPFRAVSEARILLDSDPCRGEPRTAQAAKELIEFLSVYCEAEEKKEGESDRRW